MPFVGHSSERAGEFSLPQGDFGLGKFHGVPRWGQ